MVLLLAEALQELFFPWVEASAGILAHLATTSPHEDVRSYAMAALPEMVRATAKALAIEHNQQHQLTSPRTFINAGTSPRTAIGRSNSSSKLNGFAVAPAAAVAAAAAAVVGNGTSGDSRSGVVLLLEFCLGKLLDSLQTVRYTHISSFLELFSVLKNVAEVAQL
eukprot:11780-Heterococcus_DN1.PRE.1